MDTKPKGKNNNSKKVQVKEYQARC